MRLQLVLDARAGSVMAAAQVAFHLAAGVDEVVVRVSGSGDDTYSALRPFVERGAVTLVADDAAQSASDWRLSARPGEFWWPHGGSFRDVLSLVPQRFCVVQAGVRQFVSRPEDGRHFAERELARPATPSSSTWFEPPPATISTIERVRRLGVFERRPVVRGWYPIDVLRLGGGPVLEGGDEDLARAAAHGAVVIDTRVRDALRTLAGAASLAAGETAYRSWSTPLSFPLREVADEAAIVCELQAAIEAEPPARVEDRLVDLDRRVRSLEQGLVGALRRVAWAASRGGA